MERDDARFQFLDSKLNDLKADVVEMRGKVSSIESGIQILVTQGAVQNKILEMQHIQLAEHIKRTNLLEHRVEQVSDEIRAEMKPVEEHVQFLNKLGKVAGWLLAAGAAIAAIKRYLG